MWAYILSTLPVGSVTFTSSCFPQMRMSKAPPFLSAPSMAYEAGEA